MRTRAVLHPIVVVAVALLVTLSVASTSFGQAGWRPTNRLAQADEYSDEYIVAQQPGQPAPAAQPAPAPKPPVAKPAPEPEIEPSDIFGPSTQLASAEPSVRLASVPNMFGDVFGIGGQVMPESGYYPHSTTFSDLPTSGAARRVKIAENNKALPTNRVYFSYNHFENALDSFDFNRGPRSFSVDQYTMGFEKTFLEGKWSCEVRMPFTGAYRDEVTGFTASTSHYGNLAILLKRLLYIDDDFALAAGLGIDTPTGSDVRGYVDGTPYAIQSNATNLLPYVGFLAEPTEKLFFQGFLQVDVPLNGDPVVLGNTHLGKLNDQTLMYLDASMGYWIYRNRNAAIITGLAGILEFHYTTTLQDADIVSGTDGVRFLTAGNVFNRLDIVNMTMGVHAQIGQLASLGVGGVVPLDDRPDRQFDAEVQIFYNQRF